MSDDIHTRAFHVDHSTDDGPIFPGRPGESLDQYLRRANEEFAAALRRSPIRIEPALNRPRDRYDSGINGRSRGRGWAS